MGNVCITKGFRKRQNSNNKIKNEKLYFKAFCYIKSERQRYSEYMHNEVKYFLFL